MIWTGGGRWNTVCFLQRTTWFIHQKKKSHGTINREGWGKRRRRPRAHSENKHDAMREPLGYYRCCRRRAAEAAARRSAPSRPSPGPRRSEKWGEAATGSPTATRPWDEAWSGRWAGLAVWKDQEENKRAAERSWIIKKEKKNKPRREEERAIVPRWARGDQPVSWDIEDVQFCGLWQLWRDPQEPVLPHTEHSETLAATNLWDRRQVGTIRAVCVRVCVCVIYRN